MKVILKKRFFFKISEKQENSINFEKSEKNEKRNKFRSEMKNKYKIKI